MMTKRLKKNHAMLVVIDFQEKLMPAMYDRNDVEVQNGMHRSDTMEEKLSLVNRFGVTINYSKPSQKEYFGIVIGLARKAGITMSDEELRAEANKWELSHGGISGRTAQQFINYLS